MKLKLLIPVILAFAIHEASAQVPFISTVSKGSATINELIIIAGSSFNPSPGGMEVYFGGVKGEVRYNSANLIEVFVPAGATYEYIRVFDTATGESAYSPNPFQVSFGGSSFSTDRLSIPLSFTGAGKLYDLCACDFNGDGKVDIAASDNTNNSVSIFRNTSTPGQASFNRITINISNNTISNTCEDIDGDGMIDIIFTRSSDDGSAGNIFYVFRNTSTATGISFEVLNPFSVPNARFRKIRTFDVSNDGKPDLIFSNQATTNSELIILENTSTPGNVSFGNTERLRTSGIQNSGPLLLRDFNNDGFLDIATAPYLFRDIVVFPNLGAADNISFGDPILFNVENTIVNLISGDFNGDGKEDIAATRLTAPQGREIAILVNQSENGNFAFRSEATFRSAPLPWGLSAGDLNGDGKTDLLVGSIDASRTMTALINQSSNSSTGSLNFDRYTINANSKSRNVLITDVDGDGRPDINYIGITDLPTAPNSLSVILNQNCLQPEIFPQGEVTICQGLPFQLRATEGEGLAYRWLLDSDRDGTFETNVKETGEPFVDVTQGGFYQVVAITNDGCEEPSGVFSQIIIEGDIPSAPGITPPDPVCIGDTMRIFADTIEGNDVFYVWNGPANFRDTIQSPVLEIPNFDAINSGQYLMEVIKGDCQSQPTPVRAESINLPNITIRSNNDPVVCQGTEVTLSVGEFPGFTYNWIRNDSVIPPTSTIITTQRRGEYRVVLENIAGCTDISDPYNLSVVLPPQPGYSSLDTFCLEQPVIFLDTSRVNNQLQVDRRWGFDGFELFGDSVVYSFDEAGLRNFTLEVSYPVLENCNSEITGSIFIVEAPNITVQSDEGFIFCIGDGSEFRVDASLSNVRWSNGDEGLSSFIDEEGIYDVEAINPTGCVVYGEFTVENYPEFEIDAIASPNVIEFEEISSLLTTGGGVAFSWSPGELLDDSLSANPVARPFNTTSFQVMAIDENGCFDSDSVTVEVIDNLNVVPQKLYSSTLQEYWEIENIETYPECEITIFTRQGLPVYGPKPYQNDFDGTTNGSPLEAGVYYYIIKCQNNQRTGSILLVE